MSRDRGGADALGLVLVAPVALAVAGLVVWIGRTTDSEALVQAASSAAAQSAVRERVPSSGRASATATAGRLLDDVSCAGGPDVTVDAPSWRPGATVTVTVRCRPDTTDLPLVGASPRIMVGTSSAVIDQYRAGPLP